jgi:arabinofuranosyltransferase
LGILIIVLLIGFLISPNPTWRMTSNLPTYDENRINDERSFYFSATGLLRNQIINTNIEHEWKTKGILARNNNAYDVIPFGQIGFFGYYSGPTIHIVDPQALADPLLARMPPYRNVNWEMGHFTRILPAGYIYTLQTNLPHFSDPDLAEYYRQLSLVISGPLFTTERWKAIWLINTGQLNQLINTEIYQFPQLKKVGISELSTPMSSGTPWNSALNHQFGDDGIKIDLQDSKLGSKMELSITGNTNYLILFLKKKSEVDSVLIPASQDNSDLNIKTIDIPYHALINGYDAIHIMPVRTTGSISLISFDGHNQYSIGHLVFK